MPFIDLDATETNNIELVGDDLVLRGEDGRDRLAVRSGGPTEVVSGNLRLPTGNSIADGSGTARLETSAESTFINNNNGRAALRAVGDGVVKVFVRSGQDFQIGDEVGGFVALSYVPSATAPGTLRLNTAQLDIAGDSRTIISSFDGSGNHFIKGPSGTEGENLAQQWKWNSADERWQEVSLSAKPSEFRVVRDRGFELVGNPTVIRGETTHPGSASAPALQVGDGGAGFFVDANGDLVAVDEDGTTSALT